MAASILTRRIIGPVLASLAGLALCTAVTTSISDRLPTARRDAGKILSGAVLHWFGDTFDHVWAKLASPAAQSADRGSEVAVTGHIDRALALGRDLTGLREAIALYKSGDLVHGDAAAKTARDEIVQALLEWVALRNAPRAVGFDRLDAFLHAHPDWPAADWIRHRMEASLYFDHASPTRVLSFFAAEKPRTVPGRLALARALAATGNTAEAGALARAVWRDSDLGFGLENKVKSEFGSDLEKSDHRSRAERLLSKGEYGAALRAAALAGSDAVMLVKLRIAAINETVSDKMLAAVPAALQNDADFLLAKIQKLRHAEKYKDAAALLLSAPRGSETDGNGDEWCSERRLLARKVLDLGDDRLAYRLVAENSGVSSQARIDAEFLAGWIALRFLNDPARAAHHFAVAADLAETPISTARAAYWEGRAAEISLDAAAFQRSRQFYQRAAAEAATYYGQLARKKLDLAHGVSLRNLPAPATGDARSEAVRVAEVLFAIGESDLALSLSSEIAEHVSDEKQLAALAAVIATERDAHAALTVGKILNQRRLADDSLAFPTFGIPRFDPIENSAAPAVVYSVARQESAFDPHASSSAGAKGLMQLIVQTAKRTAERAGLDFSPDKLTSDAAFNAKLGAAHLGQLLRDQGGSYILAFAAYNAGEKRLKQWIDAYGDPRSPGVDPVDWVERIPFSETRNYVQRVMENLAIYQASFTAPQQPGQEIGLAGNQVHTAAK